MESVELPEGNLRAALPNLKDEQLEQIIKQANQWADYNHFTGLMNNIAAEMREIPVLPSEKITPEDTKPLQKVEFPKEGGVLTWMEGFDYPYKGYPHHEFVDRVDSVKKMNRAMLSGLYHQLKSIPRWRFITVLPALWVIKSMVRAWVHVFYRAMERTRIKPERYCVAVRDIYASFNAPMAKERAKEAEFRTELRDLVCMVLEMDNAYRYRAQDVLAELNKDALRKHPRRELVRLLDLLASRERHQEVRDTWKLIRAVVRFYLLLDPTLTKTVAFALSRIQPDNVRLDTMDKAYCLPRKDYTFGFQLYPQLEDENLFKLDRMSKELKRTREFIRDESTREHAELRKTNPTKEAVEALDKKFDDKLRTTEETMQRERSSLVATTQPTTS